MTACNPLRIQAKWQRRSSRSCPNDGAGAYTLAFPTNRHLMQLRATLALHGVLAGLRWVILATLVLFAQAILPYWLFVDKQGDWLPRVQQIFALFTLLVCLHVWACVSWLSPCLRRIYPAKLASRLVCGQLAIFAGVLFITVAVYLQLFPWLMGRPVNPGGQFAVTYRTWMVASFVYGWLLVRDFAAAESARALQLRLETQSLATDVDRAELAMLEVQIEPHFLFNTLAHVKRLYRHDAAAAGLLLGTLIDYLAQALPALRRDDWRLGDELDLVELYLNLIGQRFGARLQYSISAPSAARATTMPALSVATLVENAVRHGLGPKADVGCLDVRVTLGERAVLIEVADNGVGLRPGSGSGLGLATVRARLRACFGARATLEVAARDAGGVLASIRIAQGSAHA